MALNFPISSAGKRGEPWYYEGQACADSIVDPSLNYLFSLSCVFRDSISGDIPYRWKFLEGVSSRLYIGTSCNVIGRESFYGGQIASLIIPENVSVIGQGAFFNSTVSSLSFLGSGIEDIGVLAFQGSPIAGTLTIPSSIIQIRDRAFRSCNNISRVEILAVNAPVIGSAFTFDMTGITEIHVPSNATGYAASYQGKTVVYDLPAG